MANEITFDELWEQLKSKSPESRDFFERIEKISALVEQLRELGADFEWVVRCKNCARRGDPAECPMCFFIEGDWADYTRDDGYCDRGERWEENAAD